mmetsp:Transcript_16386/g.39087  ORF Transcript_16386/g.39087 Transcript_16386/m.39087 type:complete len:235 (+) Transcript_16386:804-1508(+)
MTSSLPLSGTWCRYALKPDLPANGRPPRPPSAKPSPQRLTMRLTSCSSLPLTSSEHTLCASSVFLAVKPRAASVLATLASTSPESMAVGKMARCDCSARLSMYSGLKTFCAHWNSAEDSATTSEPTTADTSCSTVRRSLSTLMSRTISLNSSLSIVPELSSSYFAKRSIAKRRSLSGMTPTLLIMRTLNSSRSMRLCSPATPSTESAENRAAICSVDRGKPASSSASSSSRRSR